MTTRRVSPPEQARALFAPCSKALKGASSDSAKNAARPLRYLNRHGFAGRLLPVNTGAAEIDGMPCDDLPEPVDYAFVMVGADQVAEAVRGRAPAEALMQSDQVDAVAMVIGSSSQLHPELAVAPLRGFAGSGQVLDEVASRAVFDGLGIAGPKGGLASTAEEARAIHVALGRSVALKIVSDDSAHKSDSGGLILGLDDGHAVADGFERLIRERARALPSATLRGVLVQAVETGIAEALFGYRAAPQAGPMVMLAEAA